MVLIDNNPLAHLQNTKLEAAESRWLRDLNGFTIYLKYRLGKENANADRLSRNPLDKDEEEGGICKEMWEVMDRDELEKGVVVVKLWGNIQL